MMCDGSETQTVCLHRGGNELSVGEALNSVNQAERCTKLVSIKLKSNRRSEAVAIEMEIIIRQIPSRVSDFSLICEF